MTEIQNPTEEPVVEPVATETTAQPVAEEATAQPAAEESCQEEPQAEISTASTPLQSKAEVLARLHQIAETDEESSRQELDMLKSLFYRLHKQEIEEAYKSFIDGGGTPEEYTPAENNDEADFKNQMAIIREKRAQLAQQQEAEREANYQKKLEIIEKIKAYIENPDEVNRVYNDFKQLQQEWNEIKNVPAEKATELWKTYQQVVEQYYDTLKLNNELRAYDFKKNLELKTALCEAAEKLTEEEDIISAFRTLQQLHAEFREIGPVASELREEIWNRFKTASTIINKRHHEFFESRKQQEEENLQKKTEICETIEAYDLSALKTFAEWNAISEKITELQALWKTIGFAPQKMNVKIFERFRAACDKFFTQKAEYFQGVRNSLNENYEAKLALVEKAESLKDSTAWKETTDILVELQKKWKEIGTVPKKYSDQIWQRFNAACDAFFEAKKEANADTRSEQLENMQKKQAIIDRLAAIEPADMESELRDQLRAAQKEWNEIGHVPFKEKDKLYKLFREQMDRLYGAASANATRRRVNNFKNTIKEGGADKLRDRLVRQLDILRNEIKTYENNLGFLNLSSKSKQGNALVDELNRKVDKLRSDLEEVKAKLASLDEQK
jgi:predicted transcriptional regulator